MTEGKINLENCDFSSKKIRLTSPISIKVCNQLGLDIDSLKKQSFEEYCVTDPESNLLSKEILQERYEHFEKKKEELINEAIELRNKLKEDEKNKKKNKKNNQSLNVSQREKNENIENEEKKEEKENEEKKEEKKEEDNEEEKEEEEEEEATAVKIQKQKLEKEKIKQEENLRLMIECSIKIRRN